MRGWIIVIGLLLVLCVAVQATDKLNESLCSDTDNGGSKVSDSIALKTKGDVKYGITTLTDTCLTAEDGVSAPSGNFLKEYYCFNDQRQSHIYDCVKYGYDKCESGACKGGSSGNSSSNNQTNQTSKPKQPVSECGNKITEKARGEQCDPPNSICFGKTSQEYGTCQADCTCKIAQSALKNERELPPVCGDGFKHPDEDCEEDADCPSDYVCSSCKCVKELSASEIEAMKQAALAKKEAGAKGISEKVEDEYKAPEKTEVDLTAKNFSAEPAMKATSGVANFFMKIFNWLAGIFS